MKACVADTHSLIWHLQDNPRLSSRGRSLFSRADEGKVVIVVPTIVLVEMTYLAEKKRIANTLVKAARPSTRGERELPGCPAQSHRGRGVVPDMPDRIIAATALSLGLPLLSRDSAIEAVEELEVIW